VVDFNIYQHAVLQAYVVAWLSRERWGRSPPEHWQTPDTSGGPSRSRWTKPKSLCIYWKEI
jgi:hypothetical protein